MKYRTIDLDGLDPEIDIEAAKSYIEHREKKKKPLTQRAFNIAMNKALESYKISMTPTELIDFTVDKGWDGININYTVSAKNNEMMAIQNTYQSNRFNQKVSQRETELNTWMDGGVVREAIG